MKDKWLKTVEVYCTHKGTVLGYVINCGCICVYVCMGALMSTLF